MRLPASGRREPADWRDLLATSLVESIKG